MDYTIQFNNRADNNGTLIKVLLPALIFSTDSDLYVCTNENDISSTKRIIAIQNFYAEILFKYMIFRYSYKEAMLRFAGLIKNALDQSICALRAAEVQQHEQLIQAIVKQTEQSVTLNSETETHLT